MNDICEDRIVNKIFDKCTQYTNDPFWKAELGRASRGIFMTGFSYRDGYLHHKKKNKNKPISKYISDDPATATEEFISFMNSVGKYSDTQMVDMDKRAQIWHSQPASNEPRQWTQVPEKSRKDYVERFTEETSKTYGLTSKQTKSLKDTIHIGIVLGCYTKDNIKVIGNKIESIDGIVYNNQLECYTIEPNLLGNVRKSITKSSNKKEKMNEPIIYNVSALDPVKFADIIAKDFERAREYAIKLAGGTRPVIPSGPINVDELGNHDGFFVIDE